MTDKLMDADRVQNSDSYYHLVNDTARTDAILRAARDMRWRAFRSLAVATVTAPVHMVDRLAHAVRGSVPGHSTSAR